jgi:hypothetical protein
LVWQSFREEDGGRESPRYLLSVALLRVAF